MAALLSLILYGVKGAQSVTTHNSHLVEQTASQLFEILQHNKSPGGCINPSPLEPRWGMSLSHGGSELYSVAPPQKQNFAQGQPTLELGVCNLSLFWELWL